MEGQTLNVVVAHCYLRTEVVQEAIAHIPQAIKNGTNIKVESLDPKKLPRTQEEIFKRTYAVKKTKLGVEAKLEDGAYVFVSRAVRDWLDPVKYQRHSRLFEIAPNVDPLELTAKLAHILGEKYSGS